VKTASTVLETSETDQKNLYLMNFGIGPIEYIYICVCVAHGQVLKNKTYIYIYGLKPLES
jgi:hypothetical protein